jgi:predicted permease
VAERFWRRILRLDHGAGHVERDVDQEIAFHLEMRTRKLVAAGWDPAAARVKALEQFGNLPALWKECVAIDTERERAMKWTDRLSGLYRDFAFALRSLGKHPQFTIAVVLVLAIGIGGNTAIFTLVDALLLRTLPVPHPERLVIIGDPAAVTSMWHGSPMTGYVSYPVYADIRDGNRALSGLFAASAVSTAEVIVHGATGATEHPQAQRVTGNYFDVLQVGSFAGRTFTADDDRDGRAFVAVISYGYWQRRFAGDRDAIGRVLTVGEVPLTIVGVAPPGFVGDIVGSSTDIWMPMMAQPARGKRQNILNDRSVSWLHMMGRLAPGVTLARASSELAMLERQSIRSQLSGIDLTHFDERLAVDPIAVQSGERGFSSYRRTFAPALSMLMAAVMLVALVVCANVANLMLARVVGRGRELTVRMALGAGRGRLMQLLLSESLALALAGGALGLLFAIWGSRLLLAIATPPDAPILLDISPDRRVLTFTAAVTLLVAVLFGFVPALRATRLDVATALRAQGRNLAGIGARLGRVAVGSVLVVGQVALSTMLLIAAGVLLRSMTRILTVDLGLDRDHIVSVQVNPRRSGYDGARAALLLRELNERIARVSGVRSVGPSGHGIFSGGEGETDVRIPGFVPRADSELSVKVSEVGPGFFRAVGARLLRGREFDARDNEKGERVAVVNETMARHYFSTGNAVGRTITSDDSTYTVIGVVRDVEEQDVRAKPVRRLYTSIAQAREALNVFVLEVRVFGEPSRYVAPLQAALLTANPNLSFEIYPLNDLVRGSVSQDVLVARVTTFFGFLGLVLAALGLYGVTAYATSRRTAEFGLRTALGAEPNDIVRMVLAESVRLVALGLGIGVPAGLIATRLVRSQIFGVNAIDVPSLSAAVAVLLATALVASYVPARRAARVGPLGALRSD